MKKLLKNEICGSVNIVRMHYSRTKSQQVRLPKKKKGLKRVESKTWTQEAESKQSPSADVKQFILVKFEFYKLKFYRNKFEEGKKEE